MIVAYRNGNPVRLQELGNVLDSVQNDKMAAWYDNTRAIVLAVQRQPGANTVQVVDDIKKLLPQFREQIPAAVHLDVLFDRSQGIRKDVYKRQSRSRPTRKKNSPRNSATSSATSKSCASWT